MKKITKILSAFIMAVVAVMALASCGGGNNDDQPVEKVYTYNDYTTISPSNWNELTYRDNNDTQIMSRIGSQFFEFDFKFDAAGEIVPGEFEVEYSAATKLEDVSAAYAGAEKGWGIPDGAKARAYKITLRDDLKWDDGTPIKAEDFVYTMKEQLAPEFQNYRADSFYIGSTVIHNAQNYFKQGSTIDEVTSNAYSGIAAAIAAGYEDNIYLDLNAISTAFGEWFGGTYTQVKNAGYFAAYFSFYDADGNKTDQTFFDKYDVEKAENNRIKVTAEMLADYNTCLAWNPNADEEIALMSVIEDYEYPEMTFDQVGIFVGDNEYELVLVLDNPLELLNEDGSLYYKAAYNMRSLPLVHKAKYEASKVRPATGSTIWTSTYNTDVNSTASWGPYKLTSFQSGKEFVLEKNPNWFGYNDEKYKGQYQTTRIVVETIGEWNTAWLKFLAGEIDGIGIDTSIAPDYKSSDRAYFTPDDFVASLQIQSDVEQLKARESAGINKSILGYVDFRKALSLSINRTEFASQTTTSSLAGYGLFNSMHYYDVPNGGVYRNTDYAKHVLCNIYNIDVEGDFGGDVDRAVQSITGYDIAAARELVTKAYNEALAAGDIKANDKVVITLGTGAINEVVTRRFDFIKSAWLELVKGTPLEGRLEYEVVDKGSKWADDFRAGAYDVCMGGWTGAAWDPGYFLLAYLSPDYMYSTAWKTDEVQMTFTMPGVGADGADITDTMSLMGWYACLNGSSGCRYNWAEGSIPQSLRLKLIAALEEEVLKVYYTVPLYNNFGASLISYKLDYITYEYNTFMSYGGLRYATYNYTDAEWKDVVARSNGQLNYK